MRLLDLFCGEGLAGWGYWLSGRFSEIVGVDINADLRTRYSFDFVCADVMKLDYEFLLQFDFIHASPPCQAYSKATPDRTKHPRLIAGTRLMLAAAGKPHVVENVEGSGKELKPNLVIDGFSVGLPSERRRYFYVSLLEQNLRMLRASQMSSPADINIDQQINIHKNFVSREMIIKALGLDMIPEKRRNNLTRVGMEQGIPPAMTKAIAEMVLPHKFMIA
jgi:site-specific DNA-cytosine methylase